MIRLAIVSMMAWCLPALALAATGPTVQVDSADLGFHFAMPPGLTALVEPYPNATPAQTREVVMLLQAGGEVARLDVWTEVRAKDLATWVRGDFDFMVKHGKLRSTRATAAQVPALELAMPGGQVEPQTVRFWRLGKLWCRLTLVASNQALAREAFATATATFAIAAARPGGKP